ncbi:MAG: NAD(P)-binding protein [Chitinophagales bacterium]|nr:NAD(P)-binding protein [Chitinophagales bacterium]
MKNGINKPLSRRHFLQYGSLSCLNMLFPACLKKTTVVPHLSISGANHQIGHRLRNLQFPAPTQEKTIPILIIGGGISGLSACRRLRQKGVDDFLLLDIEAEMGGNSRAASNAYTAYPLGAHYLPLPNRNDTELLRFLEESEIIVGYDTQNYPIFDEAQLTIAPAERLFINNKWQEGVIPDYGLSEESQHNIAQFLAYMEVFKEQKGADGKFLFDIPIKNSSNDPLLRQLDAMTMQQWLKENGFVANELLQYVDYCCRDDYGMGIAYVSAWAGIHYFAARKGDSTPQKDDNVLTWQQGNAYLVEKLQYYAKGKTQLESIAFRVTKTEKGAKVWVYEAKNDRTTVYTAQKVIVACPQYVAQRLFDVPLADANLFHHAPWLVATLTLRQMPRGVGFPLSWDNVILGGKGLGYVNDLHQSLQQHHPKAVITYYHAFEGQAAQERQKVYQNTPEKWLQMVVDELQKAHYNIESLIETAHFHVWGHGMICPVPNFLYGAGQQLHTWQPTIYFAHSDWSGISIFEEAFHAGIRAVDQLLDDEKS